MSDVPDDIEQDVEGGGRDTEDAGARPEGDEPVEPAEGGPGEGIARDEEPAEPTEPA